MNKFHSTFSNINQFAMMVKRFPPCLNMSAERVKKRTKFLVKKKNKLMLRKMKWSLNAVASFPQVLGVSMEKRIVPRCNVMKALMLKGLLDAEKYLVPKLNSQQSKGASAPELSEIVLKVPTILRKERKGTKLSADNSSKLEKSLKGYALGQKIYGNVQEVAFLYGLIKEEILSIQEFSAMHW
ncbi:BnaCnng65120D [Brassica napus]|uniref:(rape) hypothetical protein n=1 Tax=Brassica napus TaxID=3708 RepID=A0A078JQ77_BRANA|nr:unnamed protein product [Brassica napus]CDY69743.1 BnaCnng65120D [Brassica napus]